MSKLSGFLSKNNIVPSRELPAVHTTPAYNMKSIIEQAQLSPRPCNIFEGEELNYFFYGKPSYKIATDFQDSKFWEMPICFLFHLHRIPSIRRIYPFDSGAFRTGRHPGYISRMDITDFEAPVSVDVPRRIVGAFFDSIDDFFRLRPKDETRFMDEYDLSYLDAQIIALRDLAADSSLRDIDDRRFSIEIQSDSILNINNETVDAVILPDIYADLKEVRDFVTEKLSANLMEYGTYSMDASAHTLLIYERIRLYLKHKGCL